MTWLLINTPLGDLLSATPPDVIPLIGLLMLWAGFTIAAVSFLSVYDRRRMQAALAGSAVFLIMAGVAAWQVIHP